MKKTLIALAALAATSAFAQSTVSLTGNIDVAFASTSGDLSAANQKYLGNTVTSLAGSSISAINIDVSEDLGGGMRAGARVELDPRVILVDGGSIGTHQAFVSLSGGFGNVQLGRPNSASLDAFNTASPLGTATGGGYANTNLSVGMTTRFSRSVKYTSPNFSGFSGSLLYAPGNDNPTAGAYAGLPFQRTVTELGLKYAKGPLNISFSSLMAGSMDQAATIVPTGAVAQGSTTFNTIGANYTFGSVTGYLGFNQGKTLGAGASPAGLVEVAALPAGLDTKGVRIGAKFVMGATTLIASAAKQDIDFVAGTTTSRNVLGLRAEQALSKRTAAYLAYEKFNTGNDAAAANVAGNQFNGTISTVAVGVRHSF